MGLGTNRVLWDRVLTWYIIDGMLLNRIPGPGHPPAVTDGQKYLLNVAVILPDHDVIAYRLTSLAICHYQIYLFLTFVLGLMPLLLGSMYFRYESKISVLSNSLAQKGKD